jgi:type IV pilus assembly protein PilB
MEKKVTSSSIVGKISLFGQVLLKKGMITNEQLKEAVSIQKNKAGKLGDILVQLGYISQELLAIALASQIDYVFLPIERYKLAKDTVRLIPKELAYKYLCVALEKMGAVLTIVSADALDEKARDELSAATHCRIIPMLGAKDQLENVLIKFY